MKKVLFLLGHMNDMHIEWLMQNGKKTFIRTGEVLISKHAAVTNLYIVLSGRLSIKANASDPAEIAHITVGEVIGEMSLIESRPPSVNVIAATDCDVFAIPKSKIEDKMHTDIAFKANFYHALALFLSDRLRKTTSQLGYGDPIEDDMVDDAVLDQVGHAGTSFDQLLKKFAEV